MAACLFTVGLSALSSPVSSTRAYTACPFSRLPILCGGAVPVGLFFGRCANFVNGELYGAPTNLPIGVDFTGTGVTYHPSQLYEAMLEGLVIFFVLFALSRKTDPPRPRGFFLGTFLVLYGVFRILIEFVRSCPMCSSATSSELGARWDSSLSLPMLVVGICLLAWSRQTRRFPKGACPQIGYERFATRT